MMLHKFQTHPSFKDPVKIPQKCKCKQTSSSLQKKENKHSAMVRSKTSNDKEKKSEKFDT